MTLPIEDGGNAVFNPKEHLMDGRHEEPYETWHYLAWVRDGSEPGRLVVMRKARLDVGALTTRQRAEPGRLLPPEIRWWRVRW